MNRNVIEYVEGDATSPAGPGPRVIAHVCNDIGRWGKGFVLALSDRWPATHERFFAWHRGEDPATGPFQLGAVQFVEVEPSLWVANMVGQHRITPLRGVQPVRYEAIYTALQRVAVFAKAQGASVHLPRIGCGLAGGTWDRIEPLLTQTLGGAGVRAVVYDLEPPPAERKGPK